MACIWLSRFCRSSLSNAIAASFSSMACRYFSCISSILFIKSEWSNVFQNEFLKTLPLPFLEITMVHITPRTERNLSVLFCWSLGPSKIGVPRRFGTSSCLVSISYFSKPFNDVRISSNPKNVPA